jgi:hypothetical protein
MHPLLVAFFAVAAGFTASGIAASLYRIVARAPQNEREKLVRQIVFVVAGPTVFFNIATRMLVTNELSPLLFSFAVLALSYWSFALGLFILNIVIFL